MFLVDIFVISFTFVLKSCGLNIIKCNLSIYSDSRSVLISCLGCLNGSIRVEGGERRVLSRIEAHYWGGKKLLSSSNLLLVRIRRTQHSLSPHHCPLCNINRSADLCFVKLKSVLSEAPSDRSNSPRCFSEQFKSSCCSRTRSLPSLFWRDHPLRGRAAGT